MQAIDQITERGILKMELNQQFNWLVWVNYPKWVIGSNIS